MSSRVHSLSKHNVSSGQSAMFCSTSLRRFVSLFKLSSVCLGPASTRQFFLDPVGTAVANIVRYPSQKCLADPYAQADSACGRTASLA